MSSGVWTVRALASGPHAEGGGPGWRDLPVGGEWPWGLHLCLVILAEPPGASVIPPTAQKRGSPWPGTHSPRPSQGPVTPPAHRAQPAKASTSSACARALPFLHPRAFIEGHRDQAPEWSQLCPALPQSSQLAREGHPSQRAVGPARGPGSEGGCRGQEELCGAQARGALWLALTRSRRVRPGWRMVQQTPDSEEPGHAGPGQSGAGVRGQEGVSIFILP